MLTDTSTPEELKRPETSYRKMAQSAPPPYTVRWLSAPRVEEHEKNKGVPL